MTTLDKYGPWAVITGASDGIGQAIARRAAADGFNLVLAARSEAKLQALATELGQAHGIETDAVPVDLSQPSGVATLLDATAEREVGLAVLAMTRMQQEAQRARAHGIVAMRIEQKSHMWGSHVIEFLAIGEDCLKARVPVDHRTRQPDGVLHGGVSVVLAETLGSIGAVFTTPEGTRVMGRDINANHLKATAEGWVTGTARPVHLGRSTQVWQIDLHNDAGQLTCVSRLTVAVLAR